MSRFTVFGATGFIGRNLVAYLQAAGHDVFSPRRDMSDIAGASLGHVIYAAGVTGNLQGRLMPAVDGHVTALDHVLKTAAFDSFVYISSSRLYGLQEDTLGTSETARLSVAADVNDFFTLSKLMGEIMCLQHDCPRMMIARLSNVYGPHQHPNTFLQSLVDTLKSGGRVDIRETPASRKDYISARDAARYMAAMATDGAHGIYNVASGTLVTHQQIADTLAAAGHDIGFAPHGMTRAFPALDVTKIRALAGKPQDSLLVDLPGLAARAQA